MFLKLALYSVIFSIMIFPPNSYAQTPPIEPGVSQTLAKWRSTNYSDVRYKLNITLEKMSPTLKGTMEITVNVRKDGGSRRLSKGANEAKDNAASFQVVGSLPSIIIDWRKIKGKEDLSTILNVSVNGKTSVLNPDSNQFGVVVDRQEKEVQNYFEFNEHLAFMDGVKFGENIIKLHFTSPIATSGAAVTRYVDKEDGAEYFYSLFVPSDASTAFPVFDQPDLKVRFQLIVKYPNDWKVITNAKIFSGRVLDKTKNSITVRGGLDKTPPEMRVDGFVSTYFEETKPISTYVFGFAAGDFAEFSDEGEKGGNATVKERVKVQTSEESDKNTLPNGRVSASKIYVRKSQAEKFEQHSAEVFRLNREGLKFLESWFDYRFPFPKYDLVLIPEFPFGGMEHAGATFLREDRVIFPSEPTKNEYITRANLIFHEAAHQWFGDTVTMKWFDDLWLKEGFAEFMAYKTLEKVMPEYNAWKIFYERNKQAAYLTDITRGTTPIYQEIPNLSSAKSAYGNIVYRKAPSFLRQAEFYLGEDKFQTAVRAFLKKHEFANAEWTDLVKEFEIATDQDLKAWAKTWVTQKGLPIINLGECRYLDTESPNSRCAIYQSDSSKENKMWKMKTNALMFFFNGSRIKQSVFLDDKTGNKPSAFIRFNIPPFIEALFPNSDDYGYGIFLLDEKSRAYVLENIQNEKDDFLRTMMWGALWDSVRFYELAPEDYVALVIKNINVETDESTIATLLGRVSSAMTYYMSEPPASAGGTVADKQTLKTEAKPPTYAGGSDLQARIEKLLIENMMIAPTPGLKITYYRAFVASASSENSRGLLKGFLRSAGSLAGESDLNANVFPPQTAVAGRQLALRSKDKFDIVTRLIVLGDGDGLKLLAELEKTEIDDAAKRYAFAARAGIPTAENKAKYWKDFISNKEIPESWIEAASNVWNSPKHAELTLPYLEKALAELPNIKRNRKIFFVNGWLSSYIGGQKSEAALNIINKFLAKNANLDNDLRLKILENADNLERAVKIRKKMD